MNGLILGLALGTALCWGLARLVGPGPSRAFNLVAVVLVAAALVVLLIQAFPAVGS